MPAFEWDENKNTSNKKKHGFGFNVGKQVFDDDNRLEIKDERKDYGEKRWKIIEMVFSVVLTIVYTLRDTAIKIISARRASKKERDLYDDNLENLVKAKKENRDE